ncbi:glycoside hydrolase family 73 protein [Companilactobacillus kimchiensis]|uniref:Mannosyl-glycoprotein endo-beta-N-acetylglucosaminidase n=1 Tax=Companilactobacillus kimchiensis TaxID=993692 RepID=A0A0R2LAW3_9LACO|nr:glucosaminidase domain-containing protein [Companilactobacillus kimchiensis]KRN99071.1 mannosyl-glycoprotein endo-beta-N-acetylglucosaminidase [Companilactobacillus kimchiensis]
MNKKVRLYSSLVLVGLTLGTTVATTSVNAATVAEDNATTSISATDKNSNANTSKADDKISVSTNKEMGPGFYDTGFNLKSWEMPSLADSDFLSEIKAGAMEGWTKYKILPSLTAAQAVLESGNGTSGLSQYPFNNLFGIKGTPGQSWRTAEQDANGNVYYVNATFRTYPSFKESIEDHNALLGTAPRYSNLVGVKNYQTATARVKADGYATAVNYAASLNNIIVSDGLTSWDQEAFNTTDFPHNAVDESVITIQYVQNYGVLAYNSEGNSIGGSNQTFLHGTKWRTAGTKVINGEEMLQVSTDEYIPLKYTTIGADGTVTINYTQGYGVLGYHLDGSSIGGSNSVLKTGSVWKTDGAATINGQIMYKIATDEYVPKEFTQFGNGK